MAGTLRSPATGHYTRTAIVMHWVVGVALMGEMAFGFLLDDLAPRGTPARSAVINLHKSIGIVLLALIVLRLMWRYLHRPPNWPASMPAWQRRAALWVHRGHYACMIVLPLSGYVGSNFSRHGVRFFGLNWAPWGPDIPALYNLLTSLHSVTAYLFCALIAGHVTFALKHAWIDRDQVFARIWPGAFG